MKSKYQIPESCHLSFVTCNLIVISILSVVILMSGCDAFVRKFTRKHKTEDMPKEEMVLAPEEYKPSVDKEKLYRQYFLFWQSWHEELIESLAQRKSLKKQIDCADQSIKNLLNMRALLNEAKQKKLDRYIEQLNGLKDSIAKDIYSVETSIYIRTAESIKRAIFRDFSFNKIKKDMA